ncbi:MAG: FtsX-like permease family protein [Paracoccaceae bacterium]
MSDALAMAGRLGARLRAAAAARQAPAGFPVWRLALRDLVHDWRLSLIAVAGVCVALSPVVILIGLKLGVVEALRQDLLSDPRTLELRMLGGGHLAFDEAWFEALRDRPETGFVMPMTRGTVATVVLRHRAAEDARPVEVSLSPTAEGDPVLARAGLAAPEGEAVVLSASAARRLDAGPGDSVQALIRRTDGGRLEATTLALDVTGVLAEAATTRDVVLVPLAFLVAVEDYREWQRVERYGWPGRTPVEDAFADFRLYAADLDAVEPLGAHLRTLGVETESAAAQIARVRRIDSDLTLMVTAITVLTLAGVAVTVALDRMAAVDRKRRSLAVLRLVGYRARALMLWPLVQGATLAALGGLAAIGVFWLAAPVLGALFADVVASRGSITRLPLAYALAVPLSVVAIAALASLFAAAKALRIAPARELRHD